MEQHVLLYVICGPQHKHNSATAMPITGFLQTTSHGTEGKQDLEDFGRKSFNLFMIDLGSDCPGSPRLITYTVYVHGSSNTRRGSASTVNIAHKSHVLLLMLTPFDQSAGCVVSFIRSPIHTPELVLQSVRRAVRVTTWRFRYLHLVAMQLFTSDLEGEASSKLHAQAFLWETSPSSLYRHAFHSTSL